MRKTFLLRSSMGIDHYMVEDDDGTRFYSEQPLDDIFDQNKAMATHNDGYSPDRSLRRVAQIPFILINKWLQEEGWNALDPDCADKLKQKLNSSEYQYLRTAEGRIGVSNGVMR